MESLYLSPYMNSSGGNTLHFPVSQQLPLFSGKVAPSSHTVLDISPAAEARGIFRGNLVHFPPKHRGEDLANDGPGYGKKNLAVVPRLQKWFRI